MVKYAETHVEGQKEQAKLAHVEARMKLWKAKQQQKERVRRDRRLLDLASLSGTNIESTRAYVLIPLREARASLSDFRVESVTRAAAIRKML